MRPLLLTLAVALSTLTACSNQTVSGQELEGFSTPVKAKNFIVYSAQQQTIPAGKKAAVDLQFYVVDGFHVNSHRPKSELLIRTDLKLDPTPGVTAGELVYPLGKPFQLGDETLDVYTGAFAVTLPLSVTAGDHLIHGTLRYQACDHAACFPVKSLPVEIQVRAK